MSIPDVTSTTGGMGISRNFSATIKEGDTSGKASMVWQKVNGVEKQESEIAEKFSKADEKRDEDLAMGKKGKVVMREPVQGWDPDGYGIMQTTVDFDPKSKLPKDMSTFTSGNPDVDVKSSVKWNKDGQIVELQEIRTSDSKVETLEIRHDSKKGILYYSEKVKDK